MNLAKKKNRLIEIGSSFSIFLGMIAFVAIISIGCGGSGGSTALTTGTSTGASTASASGTSASSGSTTSSTTGGTTGSTSSGSTGSTTSSSTGSTGTKSPIVGLVTMGNEGFVSTGSAPINDLAEANAHPGVYSGVVILVTWAQLEPQQGVFDDTAIDDALNNIQSYNLRYPQTPIVGKLRVFCGLGTPTWVIQNYGGVSITDSTGHAVTIGKFWTSQYEGLWKQLQDHLASVYDDNPLIGEVAVTSGCTLTAEPFVLPFGSQANIDALHSAGYTDAQMKAVLSNAYQDYASWQNTPLDYTFNSFLDTDSTPYTQDPNFTISVMQAFRSALGFRAVVANHALVDPVIASEVPIYQEFQNLYQQAIAINPNTRSFLEFQTDSPTVDWPTTIAFGLTYHPSEIEIWDTTAAGGTAQITQSELQQWEQEIKTTGG